MQRLYADIKWVIILLAGLLVSACENDTKQLQRISAQEGSKSVSETKGVDILYSDSAHVKMHLETPLMLDYAVKKPYSLMPKGVKGTFYDEALHPTSNIVADSAISRDKGKHIELYKNVVATSQKGDVFKSDELIYDQATHRVYSSKPVVITTADGNVINGDGLITNEKFSPWTVSNTKAKLLVNQNLSQQ
ncbi:LPS export ABC transporter periplasmic protein LptC [Mucilaginibacter sp.]